MLFMKVLALIRGTRLNKNLANSLRSLEIVLFLKLDLNSKRFISNFMNLERL